MITDRDNRILAVIIEEPNFPENPFEELGYWKALKMITWMVFHPLSNARRSGSTVKREIFRNVRAKMTELD